MKELILLVGPPGSGKSTLAKSLQEEKGYVRISQDDQGKTEHLELFSEAISQNKNIVIDRMNFNKLQRDRYLDPAKKAGYKTKIIVLHENKQNCFVRCVNRKDHPTIKTVEDAQRALDFFFKNYEKPLSTEADEVEFKYNDGVKGTCIIVDLDGTLCNIDHRLHYVKNENKRKNNWKKFFEELHNDTVNDWCDLLIRSIRHAYKSDIVLCSGRPDDYYRDTIDWLYNNKIQYDNLFMRSRGDHRKDSIVKEILLDFEIKTRYNNILFAIDDRNQVVEMWRANGITCLQCAPGDF